jgi:hypothetical protein
MKVAANSPAAPARRLALYRSEQSLLTIDERREIVEVFFLSHPGPKRRGLGLGRAVADFVEWEASSGRLDEASGSPWWRAMNESFVLDLRAAYAAVHPAGVGPEAWAAWGAYKAATPDPQRALWTAHQVSLTRAVEAAAPLLERESAEERAFADIVLALVARAAAQNSPTDTTDLARSTRRLYPASYPITPPQLEQLVSRLSRAGFDAVSHDGTR